MARAVGPWLHRKCIREHGPADPWAKLLLYTVNAFMGDDGYCDPGQQAIAEAAKMGVSTVRLKLSVVSRDGWLALYSRSKPGQKWKSYAYRACIPDGIELDETCEALVESHESQFGGIEPENVTGTLYPQKGRRRAPPAHGGPLERGTSGCSTLNGEAPPADESKHRQRTDKAPPADGEKHRQPMGGKFFSEKFSKKVLSREGALARTAPAEGDEERRREKIRKALRYWPDWGDADIARATATTLEEVWRVKREATA